MGGTAGGGAWAILALALAIGASDWTCGNFGGGGFATDELRLTRNFGKSALVTDTEKSKEGAYGGADTSLQEPLFRGLPRQDPLGLRADARAGALSSLVGIAATRSIERGGVAVRIADLATV